MNKEIIRRKKKRIKINYFMKTNNSNFFFSLSALIKQIGIIVQLVWEIKIPKINTNNSIVITLL